MKLGIFKQVFVGILLLVCFTSHCQNLFDEKNSKAFAGYLYSTGKYNIAITEYHRILYSLPADTLSWTRMIRSYQHSARYNESLQYLDSAESRLEASSLPYLGLLRAYALLKSSQYEKASQLHTRYDFGEKDAAFIQLSAKALSGNWSYFLKEDFEIASLAVEQDFRNMARTIVFQKRKSPVLAGVMSGIVPGTGKIYTKRWKDGLFSLLLLGTSGWQTYRIISQKGINNFGAIFFGGLTAGFYAGNIYGSVKSARQYNEALENTYKERVDHLVDSYFGY